MNARFRNAILRIRVNFYTWWWRYTRRQAELWTDRHRSAYIRAFWTKTDLKNVSNDPESRYYRELIKR